MEPRKQAEYRFCKHLSKWHVNGLWLLEAKEFHGFTHSHEEIRLWQYCPICKEPLMTREAKEGYTNGKHSKA